MMALLALSKAEAAGELVLQGSRSQAPRLPVGQRLPPNSAVFGPHKINNST